MGVDQGHRNTILGTVHAASSSLRAAARGRSRGSLRHAPLVASSRARTRPLSPFSCTMSHISSSMSKYDRRREDGHVRRPRCRRRRGHRTHCVLARCSFDANCLSTVSDEARLMHSSVTIGTPGKGWVSAPVPLKVTRIGCRSACLTASSKRSRSSGESWLSHRRSVQSSSSYLGSTRMRSVGIAGRARETRARAALVRKAVSEARKHRTGTVDEALERLCCN